MSGMDHPLAEYVRTDAAAAHQELDSGSGIVLLPTPGIDGSAVADEYHRLLSERSYPDGRINTYVYRGAHWLSILFSEEEAEARYEQLQGFAQRYGRVIEGVRNVVSQVLLHPDGNQVWGDERVQLRSYFQPLDAVDNKHPDEATLATWFGMRGGTLWAQVEGEWVRIEDVPAEHVLMARGKGWRDQDGQERLDDAIMHGMTWQPQSPTDNRVSGLFWNYPAGHEYAKH